MTTSKFIKHHQNAGTASTENSVWVLFVLEDLRLHFHDTGDTIAREIIESTIQQMETRVLEGADIAVVALQSHSSH